ncbi:MAG: polyphosphate polymerase domain-containing protein [Oscillibacter sp.]|nr:polyphosphate polymerase domain-containing protein [Oscillibacter sp.]
MKDSIFQRHELKYLVTDWQRAYLEQVLAERMVPDVHGESTVCNLYYDTPDFRLVRRSLEKPVYKEKLRLRSYGPALEDSSVFLELKKKYKGIVYKRRISLPQRSAMDYLAGRAPLPMDCQIGREIDYFRQFYRELSPAVYLCYDRCAYFSKDDPNLRITFDKNIRWRTEDCILAAQPGGQQLLAPGQSLLEIKAADAMPLWLVAALNSGAIRQVSFSKYGRAYETLLQTNLQESRGIHCA